MRILFIYTENVKNDIFNIEKDKPLYSNDQVPFGISYLSSALKANGNDVRLVVLSGKYENKDIDEAINKNKPDIVCFSVVYREYKTVIDIADYIKNNYKHILTLAGGPHISLYPEEAIKTSLDIVCTGEGEAALVELMDRISKKQRIDDIKNIWTKVDGKIKKNENRPFNCDLDNIAFPDRELWQPYISNKNTPIPILLGRGCYYNCTYCCNHALKKVAGGQYVRFRSPENIFKEIRHIVDTFKDNDTIYFEVEAMNANKEFFTDFCTKLIEFNKTLPRMIYYGTNVRVAPNQDWNSIFKLFRKANISYVNIGLESGCERVRREIMKRNYSNEDVINAFKAARKNRIYTMLYAMIGLPSETLEEYEETVEVIRKCRPTTIHMSIFYPYKGTDLYRYCEEHNLLNSLKDDVGRNISSLDMPQFNSACIQKQYNLFYPRIYAHSKFELWYFYFLIVFASRFQIKKFNKIAIKRISHRQIAIPYVK